MRRMRSNDLVLAIAVAVACTAPAVAAKNAARDGSPAHISWTPDGPILVNQAEMTLYSYSNEDTRSEKFKWQCTNTPPAIMDDAQSGIGPRPAIGYKLIRSCVQKFPPFLADANAKPVGDFTIVDRPDGSKQWAYRGLPLYTSIRDKAPGDHNGGGFGLFGGGGGRFGGVRMATPALDLPTGVKFMRRAEGLVLASVATDRPLYAPAGGRNAQLASAESGANAFQPALAPAIASASGDWSIIEAGAGRRQYAFRGKPLFAAPAGLNDYEVERAGGWEPIVAVKAPADPADIGKQLTLWGDVYTTRKGATLYTYSCNANGGGGGPRLTAVACDDAGDPAAFMVALCGDGKECARRWHPYMAPANARPHGDWSVVEITYPMFIDPRGPLYPAEAPKVKAWAYHGKPVFTYYEDEKPGDIWGDGVKGIWGSSFSAIQVPGRSAVFE